MRLRIGFISNSSSSSFILSKKELTPEQIKGFTSWANIHNNVYCAQENHYIVETTNYYFGTVSYHSSLEDQLEGLGIRKDQYDLEG